jgi:hypothetical protein
MCPWLPVISKQLTKNMYINKSKERHTIQKGTEQREKWGRWPLKNK